MAGIRQRSGGTRYSGAKPITKKTWSLNRPGSTTPEPCRRGKLKEKIAFEATPIFVDETLYVITPLNRVIALDPETGKEKWTYDPDIPTYAPSIRKLLREASATGPREAHLHGTIDARLIALNARTGKRLREFGKR